MLIVTQVSCLMLRYILLDETTCISSLNSFIFIPLVSMSISMKEKEAVYSDECKEIVKHFSSIYNNRLLEIKTEYLPYKCTFGLYE